MPKLAYDMVSGTVTGWSKSVGEPVARGEVIAEIEADTGVQELEALSSGVLVEIVAPVGAEVAVGEPIAYLEG